MDWTYVNSVCVTFEEIVTSALSTEVGVTLLVCNLLWKRLPMTACLNCGLLNMATLLHVCFGLQDVRFTITSSQGNSSCRKNHMLCQCVLMIVSSRQIKMLFVMLCCQLSLQKLLAVLM